MTGDTLDSFKQRLTEIRLMQERFDKLFSVLATPDGLIPTNCIQFVENRRMVLIADPSIEVKPHPRIDGLFKTLVGIPDVWKSSSIRVNPSRPVFSRAPVRGVSFHKAIDIVREKREHISSFAVPNLDNSAQQSLLLVRLRRLGHKLGDGYVMEAWQWIGQGDDVNYAHALLNEAATHVHHFDTALVHFSTEEDAQQLMYTGIKSKGVGYEKFFRIDINIKLETFVDLVSAFFPIDILVEEYFDYKPNWPKPKPL